MGRNKAASYQKSQHVIETYLRAKTDCTLYIAYYHWHHGIKFRHFFCYAELERLNLFHSVVSDSECYKDLVQRFFFRSYLPCKLLLVSSSISF